MISDSSTGMKSWSHLVSADFNWGTQANQPTASRLRDGQLYYVTDLNGGTLQQCQYGSSGYSWVTVSLGLSSTWSVSQGGTGRTTFTAYAVVCGGTSSTSQLQSVSGVGSSGQVLTSNGASALPTWQAASGGTEATQAEMEAATGSTQVVTPRRVTSSPYAAKAWCNWDGTASSPITINEGKGVTNVTKAATGKYTVNFSVTFSTSTYCAQALSEGAVNPYPPAGGTKSTTAFEIWTTDSNASPMDSSDVSVLFFGDL